MTTQTVTTEALHLSDSPAIPGLTFRRFRGPSDYPNILAVIHGTKHADGVERSDTLEDIERFYTHLTNCDPYKDMVFAEVDGKVIGFSRVWWGEELNGDLVYSLFGFVLPEWRRKRIGTAMFRHSEARMREIATGHQASGNKILQRPFVHSGPGLDTLLKNEGYEVSRWMFEMTRPLDEPIKDVPLAGGFEVRPVTREHMRAIWEADGEAFRDHWGYVPRTEQDWERWSSEPIHNPALWKVAFHGDQIAGMVLNFVDEAENKEYQRKRGYTEDISVQREFRKRGLARYLLTESVRMFKDMGMDHTALGVDAQNPTGALHVYESVGYKVAKEFTWYRKPLEE